MSFLDQVNRDLTEAMRSRDQLKLGTLRMLKTALVNREVEKGRPLDEAEARQVVNTLVKQRRESIEQFERGGRRDLAEREAAEIGVLDAYLPPAATPDDIARAVTEAIGETGATSPKDIGRVMKAAMGRLAGKTVDGRQVNEAVRMRLSG